MSVSDRLTVRQVAVLCGLGYHAVAKAVRQGRLAAERTPSPGARGGWVYTIARAEAERYRDREHCQRRRG